MNDDNNSELFTSDRNEEQSAPVVPEKKAVTPAEKLPAGGPVITENTVVEETEIPDIDAGSARSCGEFLRQQRERLKYSCEEVFSATKIKPDLIMALEEEDFSRLPQPVYVIAYVKRLCQFYNINNALAREFLERLRQEIDFDVPEDMSKSVKGSDESEENRRRIRNLAIVTGLVLILLIFLFVFGVTMVVITLRKPGSSLDKTPVFNENTLVEMQVVPKVKMTEL